MADQVSDDRMADLVEVSRFGARAAAEQRALVLVAAGIDCQLIADAGVISLCVRSAEAARAGDELASFERENAAPGRPRSPARAALRRAEGALVYAAVLLFFFAAARRHALAIDWLSAGAANAGRILDGEWWRTVTALALHTELGHLMGNLAFGMAISLLAAEILGSGLAWLAMLVSGAFGNALDAVFHAADHTAIGASTALFGALGILSGHTRRSQIVPWRGGLRRWAPIGAGIMLLTFLGFGGERTDVGAHVAGFAVGVVIGFVLAHAGDRVPQGALAQRVYGALAAGLFALAWLLALDAWSGE
jgi:membrane associated rhomboid family serine protease